MPGGRRDYSPQYDSYTSEEYPPDWQARRRKVLRRDGYTCQACGLRSTRVDDIRFDVDHVVPKSDGGSHALDNLQTLCPPCHARKHPGNSGLKRRARQFDRRNRSSMLVRLLTWVVGLVVPSVGSGDDVVVDDDGRRLAVRLVPEAASLPEDSGVTVEVTVTELWNSTSGNVQQMGRVRGAAGSEAGQGTADDQGSTDTARFVVWAGNDHPHLQQGRRYRLVGAKTNVYDGSFQLVVDGQTVVQPVE